MLSILKSVALCGDVLQLLTSYMSKRFQVGKLCREFSSVREIIRGVPHDSVLGPLLFSIYTNQFPKFVKYSSINMYADDSRYSTVLGIPRLKWISKLNEDLETLADMSRRHSLHLNIKKPSGLVFGSKNIGIGVQQYIKLQNTRRKYITFLDFRDHIFQKFWILTSKNALRLSCSVSF